MTKITQNNLDLGDFWRGVFLLHFKLAVMLWWLFMLVLYLAIDCPDCEGDTQEEVEGHCYCSGKLL